MALFVLLYLLSYLCFSVFLPKKRSSSAARKFGLSEKLMHGWKMNNHLILNTLTKKELRFRSNTTRKKHAMRGETVTGPNSKTTFLNVLKTTNNYNQVNATVDIL